ncbi:hypothetical protein CCP2SC5_1040002 [Azospirillaceae bacterium]
MTARKPRRTPSKPPVGAVQLDFLQQLLGSSDIAPMISSIVATPQPVEGEICGRFDDDQRTRRLLNDAIRNCGRSRLQIAAEMARVTGREIGEAHLNNWTGATRPHHAKLRDLRALVSGIGHDAAFDFLTEMLEGTGFAVIDQDFATLASIGELAIKEEFLRMERERLVRATAELGRLPVRRRS